MATVQLEEHHHLHDVLYIALHRSKSEVEGRGHKWDVADALAAVELVLIETEWAMPAGTGGSHETSSEHRRFDDGGSPADGNSGPSLEW